MTWCTYIFICIKKVKKWLVEKRLWFIQNFFYKICREKKRTLIKRQDFVTKWIRFVLLICCQGFREQRCSVLTKTSFTIWLYYSSKDLQSLSDDRSIFFPYRQRTWQRQSAKKVLSGLFLPISTFQSALYIQKGAKGFLKFWVNWMAMNIICSENFFNSPQYSCEFKPSLEALAHKLYIPHTTRFLCLPSLKTWESLSRSI